MSTPQYLLAKYIPDLRRGEPRNVGIVVWSDGNVEARFLGEKVSRPGEVDGRSVPAFVTSPPAYKQWIEYWRLQLGRESIIPATGGCPIGRNRPEFLSVLMAASKGNFVLVEGGFLLDPVAAEGVPALADYLYATLVDAPAPDDPRDTTLDDIVSRILQRTGMTQDPNFHVRYELPCQIGDGREEKFNFDYAYENGTLRRLYKQLPFPRRHDTQQMRVDATAWKFDRVNLAGILNGDRPVAIVYPTDEQLNDPETKRMLGVLETVGRVLDLHDEEAAEAEFAALGQLSSY